jgi:putative peptidoglycan lipid II flippase
VPRDPGGHVLRTVVRCLVAAALPAAVALGAARLAEDALGRNSGGEAVGVLAGGVVLAAGYLAAARRMRVAEVDVLLGPLLRAAQGARAPGRTGRSE